MHSDNEHENDNINRRDIDFKIERFLEQSQSYLKRLPPLKRQLNEINRLYQFDLYVQKLNEIGKIVQTLAQNIRNIEQLHLQLTEKYRVKHDRKILLLRTEINNEMSEFHTLRNQAMASSIDENLSTVDERSDDNNNTEQNPESNGLHQRHVTETNRLNDSYDLLEQDLILLRDTMNEVAQLVQLHKEKISHTEQLIHIAHDQIRNASTLLQKAVQNKYFTLASGAILGASLGGPIGCIMGLKIGALAALSGSAVGAFSVNRMQQKMIRNEEQIHNNHDSYNQAML
ncbi:unnamed protein product [Adineta steineri]|uniref:STX17-like N-terminal domain-containing protein n=1 Tax=Adineta steineri TaxID=433720 RepID=A0A818S812_9BILA|nr:unnamed protein product [Adineta steineri]CAF3663022.1 unnamed protein product [Adineta steineri]